MKTAGHRGSWVPLAILVGLVATLLAIIVPNAGSAIIAAQCGPPGDPCLGGTGGWSPGDTSFAPSCSPVVIDVSGDGFHLTSAQDGVKFDISGSGKPIQTAWTARGASNAFLALDRNGNGVIDSGKELFGNFTQQPSSAEPNGFLALAEFDKRENGGNGDGVIDQKDLIFSSLRLWLDANHDGICQPEELFKLPDKGIFSISLNYRESRRMDQYGNQFRFRAKVNIRDQQSTSEAGPAGYDVFLTTQ